MSTTKFRIGKTNNLTEAAERKNLFYKVLRLKYRFQKTNLNIKCIIYEVNSTIKYVLIETEGLAFDCIKIDLIIIVIFFKTKLHRISF